MTSDTPYKAWIGKRIGDVHLQEVLHESAQGVVFLGSQMGVDRQAVVKLLPEEQASPERLRRFLEEAATLGQMRHANVVTLYDVGRVQDRPYLVMEYIPGEPLSAVMRREGPLAPDRALGIAQQIAHALEEAHRHKILHRNLSPANVMIEALAGSQQELAKLMNFDAARWRSHGEVDPLSSPQRALYMTPEEGLGAVYTIRGELYVCGVLLHQMLTGQSPYHGETPEELWDEIVSQPHIPLEEARPELVAYPELQPLMDQFLSKKPELRPQDARSARLHLGQCLAQVQARGMMLGHEPSSSFPVINTVEHMPALPRDLPLVPPRPYHGGFDKRPHSRRRVVPSSEDMHHDPDSGGLENITAPHVPVAPSVDQAWEQVQVPSVVTEPLQEEPSRGEALSEQPPPVSARVASPTRPVARPEEPPTEEPAARQSPYELDLEELRWSVRQEAARQRLMEAPNLTLSLVSLATQLPAEVNKLLEPVLVTQPPSKLFVLVCEVPSNLRGWLGQLQEVAERHLLRVGVAFGRRLDRDSGLPPRNTMRMSLRAATQAEPGDVLAARHAVNSLQMQALFSDLDQGAAGRYSSFLRFSS